MGGALTAERWEFSCTLNPNIVVGETYDLVKTVARGSMSTTSLCFPHLTFRFKTQEDAVAAHKKQALVSDKLEGDFTPIRRVQESIFAADNYTMNDGHVWLLG